MPVSWEGTLFDETTGAAGARVKVAVGPSGVTVERDGADAITIDADRLAVSLGGWDGAQAMLEEDPPAEPRRMVFVSDPAVLTAIAALSGTRAAEQARSVHAKRSRGGHGWAVALGLALALCVLVIVEVVRGFPTVVSVVLRVVPTSWEVRFGESYAWAVAPEPRHVKDPAVVKPLEEAFRRLVAVAGDEAKGMKFRLIVLKDPDVNAFALPGGTCVLLTGLVDSAKSVDEVTGVLAHEVQHAIQRHSVRAMARRAGFSVLLALISGDASAVASMMGDLAGLRFSRGQESEADAAGAQLLARAGLPISPMADFFERLAKQEGAVGRALEILNTHPASAGRATELRRLAAEAGPPKGPPLAVDWPALQVRCRAAARQ